jgi:hypothetical protein
MSPYHSSALRAGSSPGPRCVRLTNRLWRAIAACFRERETQAELMVWAKVRTDAWTGKRHAFTEIPLTPDQELAIRRLIWESFNPHLQFCLQHEREHNPDCPF